MKVHNRCCYEPFYVMISRSAFVASIGTSNCRDVTFRGDVYVKDNREGICKAYLPLKKFTIQAELGYIYCHDPKRNNSTEGVYENGQHH